MTFALTIFTIPLLLSGASFTTSQVANAIATGIAAVLTTPFTAAVTALIYFELRVRKEGFDLALLAQRMGVAPPPGGFAPTPWAGAPAQPWGQPPQPNQPWGAPPPAGAWDPMPGAWSPPPPESWAPPPQHPPAPGWAPPPQSGVDPAAAGPGAHRRLAQPGAVDPTADRAVGSDPARALAPVDRAVGEPDAAADLDRRHRAGSRNPHRPRRSRRPRHGHRSQPIRTRRATHRAATT